MSEWSRFQDQFRETAWERTTRQRLARQKAVADRRCWQCGKDWDKCDCQNLKDKWSAALTPPPSGQEM